MKKRQIHLRQTGFTLVELIIAVVIVGILSAVAIPHFVSFTSEARIAKMKGALGAVSSATALVHAKWLMKGSPSAGTITLSPDMTLDIPTHILANGTLTPTAFLNKEEGKNIAGLDPKDFTVATSDKTLTVTDKEKTTCSFTATFISPGQTPKADIAHLNENEC